MIDLIKRRIDRSNSIISKMLSLSENPYLALSFGKDSLVMLDLLRKQKPNIPCIFLKSEESNLMYNYDELIDRYVELGVNIEVVETFRLTENNLDWEVARKKGNKDFYLEPFFRDWTGVFMGLRIEESKQRRISLIKKSNNIIYDKIMMYKSGRRKGMMRCCPMAYWQSFEIMLYLKEMNLPFLDVYNEGEHIRTTARLTGDAVRNNTLFWIKKNKPENWNKLKKLIPELSNFT